MSTDKFQLSQDDDGLEAALRKLLSRVLTASNSKRLQLSEQLSVRAGRRISCSMLNAYCSMTSETARFPAALILPLAELTGDDRIQRFVMGQRLRKLVRLGELVLAGSRHERELDTLREDLLNDSSVKDGSR